MLCNSVSVSAVVCYVVVYVFIHENTRKLMQVDSRSQFTLIRLWILLLVNLVFRICC